MYFFQKTQVFNIRNTSVFHQKHKCFSSETKVLLPEISKPPGAKMGGSNQITIHTFNKGRFSFRTSFGIKKPLLGDGIVPLGE